MQFQVPQFIEIEDKIVGPLTFKQFIYIAGGAGLAYIFWRVLPLYIAGPLVAGSLGLGAGLAFAQYNGQPFIQAIEHGFFYLFRSKLYLWNNERREKKKQEAMKKPDEMLPEVVYIPKLSESRLSELAWSLDIKERIAQGVASGDDREGDLREHANLIAPIRTSREALVR